MRERVLEFEEALAEVLRHALAGPPPSAKERVSITEAAGRVLASAVRAERDQPPFARSTRDGYAVRSGDVAAGRGLRIVGSVRAGEQWRGDEVRSGEAIEIMTGAPAPAGTDAVLMVEHATVGDDGLLRVAAGRALGPGENIVAQGAEARADAELIPVGRRLGAAEIAMAASCGYAQMDVFARPRVAIVATGDELVELDAELESYQIRNSNSYALAALVGEEDGEAVRFPTARDVMSDLRERIIAGREADLLLLSGGVSMGKYDLVEQALREAGAELIFTGAWIQPGKPVVFGRMRRDQSERKWTYFFGLPGNPVSTEVCFRLFVAPMLRALAGQTEISPRFVEARLAEDVKSGARVTRFLPAVIESDWQHVTVRLVPWQGSGNLAANARASGFVVLPGGVERFAAGESVRVLLR
ncbi:MAG TPA: gephyrin-like molybdotransferase Glp [Acidobacteriaceae bacterium]